MSTSASTNRDTTLVQPILVHYLDDSRAIDIIAAAACASAMSLDHLNGRTSDDIARNEAWFNGSMTKTVRRISKETAWQKFVIDETLEYDDCMFVEVPHTIYYTGAVAMPVTTYTDLKPIAKRAQVSGTDLPYEIGDIAVGEYTRTDEPHATIYLHGELGMTMGKMAAQAAHAACMLSHTPTLSVDEKLLGVYPDDMTYVIASAATMNKLAEDHAAGRIAGVIVRDNGLTEIEAGSITAIGIID